MGLHKPTSEQGAHSGHEPEIESWYNLTDYTLTFVRGTESTDYEPSLKFGEVYGRADSHCTPVVVGGSFPVDTWITPSLGWSELPPENEDVNFFVHKVVFDQNPDRRDIFYCETKKRGKKNIVERIYRH